MPRYTAYVDLHLILRDPERRVLLGQRQNTGWADGQLGLPSGHLEDGESATIGMAREADEEIGVLVKTVDLRLVHVLHQHTNSGRVALFFEATDWSGQITNREPGKCAGWTFVDPTNPPVGIVAYIADALARIDAGETYSERGWSTP